MTDLPDEETVRVRRAASTGTPPDGPGDALPGDATQPSGQTERAGDTEPDTESGTADRRRSADTVAASQDGTPGPTRRRSTYVDGGGGEQTDGSTFIARRETRRRAERVHATTTPGVPASGAPPLDAPAGRVASVPDTASDVYRPRTGEPAVVARTPPQSRAAQAPVDGDAASAAERRKARRTALLVVVAASVLALAAGASLIALTINL
ncbi:hypothetical protein SAMN04487846_0936 [Microbacterium sp. cf046]|uniref:hypothetical protein n=1 Tax=Microbacterium sp. cf046 TaxID=1761803 RepID=UPI0008EAAC3C|nr:hypothetical protein [Microbacterium sp. cf046]SFR94294.1 hypothetical protein SAMN04487846_0936 [Microbacterium sp. cf046]